MAVFPEVALWYHGERSEQGTHRKLAMTEKPERGKRPEENGSEKESDAIQWEELDFDELLGEEEPEKDKQKRKDTTAGGAIVPDAEGDTAMGDEVEDIEDLLDVREEEAEAAPKAEPEALPEELSVDDLLDVEEPSKAEDAAETVAETPREIDIDALLADDLVASGEGPAEAGKPGASDTEGRSDVEELLADDFLAEEVPEGGVPASEEAAEAEPDNGEETAEAAPAPAQEKRGKGLKKLGKKSGALSKKERVARKAKPEKKERRLGKTRDEAAPKEPKPSAAGAGAITFVCSECYEELLLSPKYGQDIVTCPECLHVGKRPDDDFLRTVRMHKSGERRSFSIVSEAPGSSRWSFSG